MKKTIFTFLILFFITVMTYAQQLHLSDEKFYYEIGGLVYVRPFDISNGINLKEKVLIPKEKLQFKIECERFDTSNQTTYYVIQFPFKRMDNDTNKVVEGDTNNLKDIEYIKSGNNKYYWMRKDEFDKYTEENNLGINCIFKSYKRGWDFTYGANLSLPFKLRTKVNDRNVKIETDIALGGFVGLKWRLSRTKKIYTSAIVSAGYVTLSVNNESFSGSQSVEEGKILGYYYSVGAVMELNGFEFGAFWGFDRASGEIGKYWIYNNKPWLSLSIGYSLFGPTSDK